MSEKVIHACGASTNTAPAFHLLPYFGLLAAADRFALGETAHGHDNWRKGLADRDYVLKRLGHVIDHCLKLREQIEGRASWESDHDGDSAAMNAGAVAWGGLFLAEAVRELEAASVRARPNCSACGGAGRIEERSGQGDISCPACQGSGKSRLKG